jgi:pimeloyl-ACP methyl ester carboxylesterase
LGSQETVAEARERPAVFAGKRVERLASHLEAVSARLGRKPVVVGHSFGGLLAQILAGRGRAAASVAISPAPFRGVLSAPISMVRSALPVLRNPANRRRAVSLTYEQFRYSVENATDEREAAELFARQAVPAGAGRWSRTLSRTSTREPRRGSTPRIRRRVRC